MTLPTLTAVPSDPPAADGPNPVPAARFFVPFGTASAATTTVSASGVQVRFADGSTATDLISGLWNASLGFGNVAIAEAIHEANLDASTLPMFRAGSTWADDAAAQLVALAGPQFDTVVFSTSGSAAVDATVKLTRQFQALRGAGRRKRVLSLGGSYHGMTLAAMGVTGEELQQEMYGVDPRAHLRTPCNDVDALDQVMRRHGDSLASVFVEPVLGSGAHVVSDAFVERLQGWRSSLGFTLVADEVATGFHRTGPLFASQAWPAVPDVLVLSKALTNGTYPASAVVVGRRISDEFRAQRAVFWHGETQAGSPQAAAAVSATLSEMRRLDAAGAAAETARVLGTALDRFVATDRRVTVTGRGCMRALHLTTHGEPLDGARVAAIVDAARAAGVLVQPGPSCVQLLPAFTIDPHVLTAALATLTRAISASL